MKDSDYTMAHYHEGEIGLRIMVATPGKTLSEMATREIRRIGESIYKAVLVDVTTPSRERDGFSEDA